MTARPRPILIFDGECGICARVVAFARSLDRAGEFEIVPFQSLSDEDLASRRLTRDQCARKIQLVSASRKVHSGAFAMNYFFSRFPPWNICVGLLYLFPPFLLLEIVVYAWVARNRIWISRKLGIEACKIEGK